MDMVAVPAAERYSKDHTVAFRVMVSANME
jgi:hypothetical protein